MQRAPLASLLLSGALLGSTASAELSLESFSNLSTSNAYFVGAWEAGGSLTGTSTPASGLSQGDGVFDIVGTGVTNDADSYLEIHYPAALDLSSYDAVSLAGQTLTGNQATSLEVRLFDSAGASAYAALDVASLPAVATWVADRGFNSASIETVRVSGGQLEGTAALAIRLNELEAVDSLIVLGYHDADYDRDRRFSLSELLRVIELYNTRQGTTRTGRYLLNSETVDGYNPDPTTPDTTPVTLARYHSADADRDGKLSLSELLRVIALYNFRNGTTRTGEYHRDLSSSDGFESGPNPAG